MRSWTMAGVMCCLGTIFGILLVVKADRATSFAAYLPLIQKDDASFTGYASSGAPIAVSPLDETIWVVNPDAGSVSVIEPAQFQKIAEIAVGQMPWSLVISLNGRIVYILDRAMGTLVVVDALTMSIQATVPIGAEPGNIALTPDGSTAYITLTVAAQVAVVDTNSLEMSAAIPVASHPYALAVTEDKVYITHLHAFRRQGGEEGRDDGRQGQVTVLDAASQTVSGEITLAPDTHGFPNLLLGITVMGNRAWLPHVRAAPDLPRGLTTTVFAAVSVLNLAQGVEEAAAHLPLNDQEIFGSPVNNPVAALPAPDGQTLYLVLAGSNLVEVVDISASTAPRLVTFLPVGKNPRGMALSGDGRYGYIMNYLSRSVTVLDLETLTWLTEVPVTAETLPPDVLQGKILFNNATNPRLSQGSWISCASCHPDGGTDSVTWLFPDGPRQTPPLWHSNQTLPWHWSAALDEAQDVEDTIEHIQHGLGLAPGTDPPLLGIPNNGRSLDLDALGAFMIYGIHIPNPPSAEDVSQGRELFQVAGCMNCHGGANWTNSTLSGPSGSLDPDGNGMVDDVLIDVGTLNPLDVRGGTGFDPPSLLNVGLTPPYLHDGSMPTLEALLVSGHPDPQGNGNGLNQAEIIALAHFLQTIGPSTPPFISTD